MDPLAEGLLQELGKQLAVLHLHGQENFLGHTIAREIILLDQGGDRLLGAVSDGHQFVVLVQEVPVHVVQHREAAFGCILIVAHHIGMGHGAGCHQLLLSQVFNGQQTIPQQSRPFKLQRFCRGFHLPPQVIGHGLVLPLQEQDHLLHGGTVCLGGLAQLTPTVTVVHVVVEARAALAHVPREYLAAARQMKGQPQCIHQLIGHGSPAIGAEVIRAVAGDLADQLHHRVFCPAVDAQIRVALVVLQEDIVFGHMPLDQ